MGKRSSNVLIPQVLDSDMDMTLTKPPHLVKKLGRTLSAILEVDHMD